MHVVHLIDNLVKRRRHFHKLWLLIRYIGYIWKLPQKTRMNSNRCFHFLLTFTHPRSHPWSFPPVLTTNTLLDIFAPLLLLLILNTNCICFNHPTKRQLLTWKCFNWDITLEFFYYCLQRIYLIFVKRYCSFHIATLHCVLYLLFFPLHSHLPQFFIQHTVIFLQLPILSLLNYQPLLALF